MMHNKLIAVCCCLLLSTLSHASGDVSRGKSLFSSRSCIGCHAIGTEGSATTGPNLAGVAQRLSSDWLKRWLLHPESMMDDPEIKALLVKYPTPMPNLGLDAEQADDLIAFLRSK